MANVMMVISPYWWEGKGMVAGDAYFARLRVQSASM